MGRARFSLMLHMSIKKRIKWEGNSSSWLRYLEDYETEIATGRAQRVTYYWSVSKAQYYATECYIAGERQKAQEAARLVVEAVLRYFYGDWRKRLPTPEGTVGQDEWNPFCLWYEELMRSLPWACALGDWDAVRRMSQYPPENKLPEAAKARGETAWGWALVALLRGRERDLIEHFLVRAESDKAKRPKLLCPVLRALLGSHADVLRKSPFNVSGILPQKRVRKGLG